MCVDAENLDSYPATSTLGSTSAFLDKTLEEGAFPDAIVTGGSFPHFGRYIEMLGRGNAGGCVYLGRDGWYVKNGAYRGGAQQTHEKRFGPTMCLRSLTTSTKSSSVYATNSLESSPCSSTRARLVPAGPSSISGVTASRVGVNTTVDTTAAFRLRRQPLAR